MSTAEGGGNIVTDGLVLCLDAANSKSIVSGSTTWTDLSRSNNNGTLVNGPTFDSGSGGSIVFDGTNDYANLGNVASTVFSHTSPWSVQFTVKIISFIGGITYPGFMVKGSSAVSGVLVFYMADGALYWKHNNGNRFVTTVSLNRIYTIVFTYAGSGNVNAYIDGQFISTVNTMVSTETSSPLYLGRGDQSGNNGFYNFLKYAKALTPEEVLQNYNVTKTRFGL